MDWFRAGRRVRKQGWKTHYMINGLILSVDRKQMSNTIVIIDWCNNNMGREEINDVDKSFFASAEPWK